MAESSSPPPDWASETEQQVLDAALKLAPAQGWTQAMAIAAGAAVGLSPGETELLLPHGPADLGALLSRRHDAAAPCRDFRGPGGKRHRRETSGSDFRPRQQRRPSPQGAEEEDAARRLVPRNEAARPL